MRIDMMDLLEIDPKLFITCRLCLEDTGTYQIVPAIQQQIKYCFDIDVQPFDSLPQLLCKKCHTLLSDYTSTKKSFVEKQVTLKEKLICKKEAPSSVAAVAENVCEPANGQHDASANNEANPGALSEVDVSAHTELNVNEKKKKTAKSKRRKRVISTSSTDSVNSIKAHKKRRTTTPQKSSAKRVVNLKHNYIKYYVCRVCSLMFKDKKSVKCHNYTHSLLRANHHDIFDVKCKVKLSKLDEKPNITGLNNTVVISKTRIIQDDDSDVYHILYIAKNKQFSKSGSSDDDLVISNKKRKRRRLDSQSSNDTVFLGNNNNTSHNKVTEINIKSNNQNEGISDDIPICINIDDSSDSNMETIELPEKNSLDTIQVDMKAIENIITVCRNKYEMRLKKSQLNEDDSSKSQLESQLQHKLLSFGRKSLNAKGMNCTGLLRYLEHKNLNVIWEPMSQKTLLSVNRQNQFVKVGAVKKHPNLLANADSGWTDIVEPEEEESTNMVALETSNVALNETPAAQSDNITSSEPDAVNHIVLSDVRSVEETSSKKLLNVNPVANPKQLPKKVYNDTHTVMPVITSTKSLAPEVSYEVQQKHSEIANSSSTDKAAPRIKVKPVSELMNPQPLMATDQHNRIWNYNQNTQNGTGSALSLLLTMNTAISQINTQPATVIPISSSRAEPPRNPNTESVILDTVDMPNTKTESPFEYFRNLLLLHGITLVEANADITRDYVCLLKFKVQFKQENKSNPVTLCLSLHCAGNKFCMYIKNDLQINIHIAKMSAIWQWEILKIFQGDVSTKILNNAQKAGPKIHSYTNTFLCLLKSINRILLSD